MSRASSVSDIYIIRCQRVGCIRCAGFARRTQTRRRGCGGGAGWRSTAVVYFTAVTFSYSARECDGLATGRGCALRVTEQRAGDPEFIMSIRISLGSNLTANRRGWVPSGGGAEIQKTQLGEACVEILGRCEQHRVTMAYRWKCTRCRRPSGRIGPYTVRRAVTGACSQSGASECGCGN